MLDFSRQFIQLRDEILEAITQVCDSQHFILGPSVAAFELDAAAACGSSFAIGCASGSDALWLALAAAGIGDSTAALAHSGPPDAVITSPFSFFASASAILRAGARPIFADIDPRTFNLSPLSVAELLRNRWSSTPPVKAVLPVHLYGQCVDWDGFEAIAKDHAGLLLLEDAAQAFGATWHSPAATSAGQISRSAGSLGLAAAVSFYPTKNLAAFGDAGMVTTSSPELDTRARSLRAHGMTRRYYHDEVGWNSRLDAIQAAILHVKLRYLPRWNQQRRDRAARYDQLFREAGLTTPVSLPASTNDLTAAQQCTEVVLPYTDPRATHVFHQYVIRAPRRDELRAALAAQQMGSEIYYPVPLHLQAAFKDLGYKPGDFPQAELAAAEVLALPIYPELRDDEQQTLVEAIRRFYQ
jgi:dTDP-4-amino-4,6-dideoxygalactose transaminase